ncbi:signal peptidase I [Cellulosimicrobium sp. TH-20]|uniref:signal peptidase I n=1 Tax=Cellulosimicrobium sp. TH-20 TaxID=1980001 RepID=UPI0011A7EF21|nr:signal peptidase I [Cellulosimicrobium sp. TH-20]
MQVLRRGAVLVLWVLAAFGLVCGAVGGATAAGLIKPLVVISGSMEPGIMTGDLLVARPVPAADLAVGDVVSLPSELTGDLVTHRVEAVEQTDDDQYTVSMKGDNNAYADALDYTASGDVWKPAVQLAGWGTAIVRLTTPAVAVPLLVGLLGLLGLTLLVPPAPRRVPVHR